MTTDTIFIPVAGGKGGIGKSLLTANLSIALANLGQSTVVVDLDLGGSNLHTFLGLPNKYPGVGDFLKARKAPLGEFMFQTEWPKLKFIPGDGRIPFMANIDYARKTKLIRQLKEINARFVLMDLGAGSTYNTLDFFRMSHNGIVVTNAEQPALMCMLTFLKNFMFRTIERGLRKNRRAVKALKEIYSEPISAKRTTAQSIKQKIEAIDPESGEALRKILECYRPRIILNRGRQPYELDQLAKATQSLNESLLIKADHFGFVFDDTGVSAAVSDGIPVVKYAPDSVVAKGITGIAERIVKLWDSELENSEDRLKSSTTKIYETLNDLNRVNILEQGTATGDKSSFMIN